MLKKSLSLVLIFQFVLVALVPMTIETAQAETVNCSAPKTDADKNYCMVKGRETDNKGYSFAQLGQDAVSILTGVLTVSTGIFVSVTPSYTGVGPVYFARSITPWLLRAGAVAYIGVEVYNMIAFKRSCQYLLDKTGQNLTEEIKDIIEKGQKNNVEVDGDVMMACTGELAQKEGQVTDYCRAKACLIGQAVVAHRKVKLLKIVSYVYFAAAALELTNLITNLTLGATYTAASVGPQAVVMADKAAQCYAYPANSDAEATVMASNSTRKARDMIEDSIKYVNYEHQLRILNQSTSISNYVMNLREIDRLVNGENRSSKYTDYEKISFLDHEKGHSWKELKHYLGLALSTAANTVIPSAQAEFKWNDIMSALGIAGGVAVMVVGPLRKVVSKLISQALKRPVTRAVYFGAIGGLLQGNAAIYENRVVKTLKERSNQFDEPIKGLIPKPDIEVPEVPDVNIPKVNIPKVGKINVPKGNTGGGGCLGPNLEADESCGCKSKSNCHKMDIPHIDVGASNVKIPSIFTASTKDIGDYSNSLGNGDLDKADIAGASMLGKAGALDDLHRKLKKKYTDDMLKAKQTPIDFDKESMKMQQSLLNDIAKGMNEKAPTATGAGSPGGLASGKDGDKKEKSDSAPVDSKMTGVVAAAPPTAGTPGAIDLGMGTDGVDAAAAAEEALQGDLNNYEVPYEDINKKADADIFKSISARYLQTAYPRFFLETKTAGAEKKAAPKAEPLKVDPEAPPMKK